MGEPTPYARRRISASDALGRLPGMKACAAGTPAAGVAVTAAADVAVAVAAVADVAATAAVPDAATAAEVDPGAPDSPFVACASSVDAVPRPWSAIPENRRNIVQEREWDSKMCIRCQV